MKTVKDKKLVVGADFAGYPLKEAVVAHLKAKGWEITDMGVKADSDPNDTDLMFHRVGFLKVNSKEHFCSAAPVWAFTLPQANAPTFMQALLKAFPPHFVQLQVTV